MTLSPRAFRSFALSMSIIMLLSMGTVQAAEKAPVLVGLDGEFGLDGSISAQTIELGLRAAIVEINAAGGVLGGRPIKLVTKDTRGILARSVSNTAEFASMPDLVAVFGGRFSPMIIAQLPAIHAAKLPYLVSWAAANPIIDNGMNPNYVFRLSLRDGLAMPMLLKSAQQRGFDKVGLLLQNNAFGSSNLAAAEKYISTVKSQSIVHTAWFNPGDTTFVRQYKALLDAGAQALILSALAVDSETLVREIAALPYRQRLPILSHWGLTGSNFFDRAGASLRKVNLSVIQTFGFPNANQQMLARFIKSAKLTGGIKRTSDIKEPGNAAHAYDLMHILAKAINLAGSTDRSAIRDALEKVPEHQGLIRLYQPPFTPTRHEALTSAELLMARYNTLTGVLVSSQK